jgi:hypothetical protein
VSSRTDYQKDLAVLQSVLRGPSADIVKSEILQYFKLAVPYFVPKRCVQDITIHADRICDLVGGTPYASEKNPWPIDPETNEHLQPIFQVRLEKAGRLLSRNLGKGLLQIFGYSTKKYGHLRFLDRVIRPEDLGDVSCKSSPDIVAKSIDFGEGTQEKPKILWRSAGRMLMGNLSYVDLNIEGSLAFDVNEYLGDDWVAETSHDSVIALNEPDDIFDYVRSIPYFGTYLGGRGGNNGSLGNFLNLDPADCSLLIRTGSDEDDAHVGVVVRYDKSGEIVFDVEGCYL